jgi:hypothetical protein
MLVVILAAGLSVAGVAAEPPAPSQKKVPAATAESGRPESKPSPAPKVMDRIDLESTQVTGNRELPKVMVIVPWKHADVGNVGGRPANSLMDEVLKPLDRDVLKRELDYYEKAGQGPANTPSKPEN